MVRRAVAGVFGSRIAKAARGIREAVASYHKTFCEPKYLGHLQLSSREFAGTDLLDIGSGPVSGATCFVGARLHCLDHLWPKYLAAGYPRDLSDWIVIEAKSEQMPLADASMDAIISVNALDHVDDIAATAREVRRVLKPHGRLRFHVEYHKPRVLEPQRLSDGLMGKLFSWCDGFRKLGQSDRVASHVLANGEQYALWGN